MVVLGCTSATTRSWGPTLGPGETLLRQPERLARDAYSGVARPARTRLTGCASGREEAGGRAREAMTAVAGVRRGAGR